MISILSFSDQGAVLARQLLSHLGDAVHYDNRKGQVKSQMNRIWDQSDQILFIGATGIAVRYIAPFIKHKTLDPAVLVVDDQGKFVISLLSGHIGGANAFAEWISSLIPGSIPVITTASDGRGFESLDLYIRRHGFSILSDENLTKLMGIMVNGGRIAYLCETGCDLNYPNAVEVQSLWELPEDVEGVFIVSSTVRQAYLPSLQVVPRNLHLGMGCRKGTSSKEILDLIYQTFDRNHLSLLGVASISSIDIKAEEAGLLEAAQELDVPIHFYTKEEIAKVEELFPSSSFVKQTIGVGAVAEPCAYLSGGELIVHRVEGSGVTLAIAREDKWESYM